MALAKPDNAGFASQRTHAEECFLRLLNGHNSAHNYNHENETETVQPLDHSAEQDTNVALWCTCQKPEENGDLMVRCENPECVIQWFHARCVGFRLERDCEVMYICSGDQPLTCGRSLALSLLYASRVFASSMYRHVPAPIASTERNRCHYFGITKFVGQ